MEKIINEFKLIETDDGFRIEIKGDKQAMRKMFSNFGKHRFGPKPPFGHGFFGHGFWGGCAPWEQQEEKETAEGPK